MSALFFVEKRRHPNCRRFSGAPTLVGAFLGSADKFVLSAANSRIQKFYDEVTEDNLKFSTEEKAKKCAHE